MITGDIPLLAVGSIALLSLLLGVWQLRLNKKLGLDIRQLQQQLSATVVEPQPVAQPVAEAKPSFSASLNQVEREQKTFMGSGSSAEKYRYVASLASQGIDAQGIAAALQMAPTEVEQLLQLARLKQ